MQETGRALLTGTARGAAKGALVGLGILFAVGAFATVVALFASTLPITIGTVAISIVGGGFAVAFSPLTWLVAGGSALIGGLYRGVSDSADMAEIISEKEKMVAVAKAVNSEKSKVSKPHLHYVPKEIPDNVAKDEVPKEWLEADRDRRRIDGANNKNQQDRLQLPEHNTQDSIDQNTAQRSDDNVIIDNRSDNIVDQGRVVEDRTENNIEQVRQVNETKNQTINNINQETTNIEESVSSEKTANVDKSKIVEQTDRVESNNNYIAAYDGGNQNNTDGDKQSHIQNTQTKPRQSFTDQVASERVDGGNRINDKVVEPTESGSDVKKNWSATENSRKIAAESCSTEPVQRI